MFNSRLFSTSGSFSAPTELIYNEIKTGLGNYVVAVLELNRPAAKNALGGNLVSLLEEKLNELKQKDNVRVAVFKSSLQGAFCAGADLKERLAMMNDHEKISTFVSRLSSLMKNIQELPMATIAAMDGIALGGGLELGLACDIRICSPQSKMGLPETRLGIIPGAGGIPRLVQAVGMAKATEMILRGRIISGEEAKQTGLVASMVESPNDEAMTVAMEISTKTGPLAIKMAKKFLSSYKGSRNDLEKECYAGVLNTNDRIEALLAFKDGRSPNFKGN